MMYKCIVSALLLLTTSTLLFATTYHVGPTRMHTTPSAVANLVLAGDTVEIDAATYLGDVAVWFADNLYLKGVGSGYTRLDANGNSAEGKAIWVIKGNNCRVENIEFLNCTVPDQNGAGIRQEGKGGHVVHCYFHHNEMGILTNNDINSNLTIEYSEFSFNGFGDGYSHNVYVGRIDTLFFRYNYSHDPTVGHALKTRARHNYILYNRITEENGDGSYTIDISNGGETILMGNLIEQGANSENGSIIAYGAEGISNPIADFVVVNNTIVNNRPSGTFFFINANTNLLKLYNNLVLGSGNYINGTPTTLDSLANRRMNNIADAKLVNPAIFDYNLLVNSPAKDLAVNAGFYAGIELKPQYRYKHPQQVAARIITGTALDVGAYEYMGGNCIFSPVISGSNAVCNDFIVQYSVPMLLGSTYNWTVTGGTILNGQGTSTITVQWSDNAVGTVSVEQIVP